MARSSSDSLLHRAGGRGTAADTDAAQTTSLLDASSTVFVQPLVTAAPATPFVINVVYDASVTGLAASNPTLYAQYVAGVNAAVSYLEHTITNTLTVTIDFGYNEVGGSAIPGGATGASQQTSIQYVDPNTFATRNFTYAEIKAALTAVDTKTAVQRAAIASLNALTAPPTGAGFRLSEAQAKVLGLFTTADAQYYGGVNNGADGAVGLAAGIDLSSASGAASLFEHEITEDLGRTASAGTKSFFRPLDLFSYTALGKLEPFTAYGSAGAYPSNSAQRYFSYTGTVVTSGPNANYAYDTAAKIQQGFDAADWDSVLVGSDSFTSGFAGPVSATDLNVLNVLGYTLAPACFAAGTRLATDHGEAAVETLQADDLVRTACGALAPVRWVGHRRIDCARHPEPRTVWPVRVAPGAFADGQPRRALLLSPEHAVFVDGVLIAVKRLINGTTIAQTPVPAVTYYHVELDRHDVLLAEGLAAESYLDTGNRAVFANGGGVVALHPRLGVPGTGAAAAPCAPISHTDAVVQPVWERLAARAPRGSTLARPDFTDEPAVCLQIDGRTIRPVVASRHRYVFVLPRGTGAVRVRSRSGYPTDSRPWAEDGRRLGIDVAGIAWHDAHGWRGLAVDDAALADGWWAVERDGDALHRWTGGDASLPVPDGARMVELRLAGAMVYRVKPAVTGEDEPYHANVA